MSRLVEEVFFCMFCGILDDSCDIWMRRRRVDADVALKMHFRVDADGCGWISRIFRSGTRHAGWILQVSSLLFSTISTMPMAIGVVLDASTPSRCRFSPESAFSGRCGWSRMEKRTSLERQNWI